MKKRSTWRSIELAFALVFSVLASTACVKLSVFQIWDEVVNGKLEINPSFVSLQAGQKVMLSAMGGSPRYSFELVGAGTLVDGLAGQAEYTAPAGDAVASIRLTDTAGTESEARVLVTTVDPLVIQPSIATILPGGTLSFVASGGLMPYVFSLVSGLGSVDAAGLYTAQAEETDAVVCVEDASGQSIEATVTVRSAAQPLAIDPTSLTIEAGSTFTFSASGGTPPYIFSAVTGHFTPGTGEYNADTEGADTVRVTDLTLAFAEATVMVTDVAGTPLQIVPISVNVILGSTFQFEALGGVPPYTFDMESSYGGTVSPSGLYSAPPLGARQGTEQVSLTDNRGIIVLATVKVKKK